jgi:hypothetical protein
MPRSTTESGELVCPVDGDERVHTTASLSTSLLSAPRCPAWMTALAISRAGMSVTMLERTGRCPRTGAAVGLSVTVLA